MRINFFDDNRRSHLFPLTLTRPAGSLRVGILSIADKWKALSSELEYGFKTENQLSGLFPSIQSQLFVNGRLLPTKDLLNEVANLKEGEYLGLGDQILAYNGHSTEKKSYTQEVQWIERTFDLFRLAGDQIAWDFEQLTRGRKSAELHASVIQLGEHPIFLEEGAQAHACILNSTDGPIYIGKDAVVMEGSMIRGPFALGESSQIKMGAKIYGSTSIGPNCKVGGEVNNSVLLGYSNKGHDGFLGNSVLGEWCNLGADTNNSNLKNNYDEVKLWNYSMGSFEKTGLQFCGLIMGDHSKSGINTMFNTGTVVGVSANIFGSGFPRNLIPSFAWGGSSGFSTYQLSKAITTAKLVYQRRNKDFGIDEERLFEHLFNTQSTLRHWEKK